MVELKDKELKEINGGGISTLGALGIVGGIIFLVGVFDGYIRPLKCNS